MFIDGCPPGHASLAVRNIPSAETRAAAARASQRFRGTQPPRAGRRSLVFVSGICGGREDETRQPTGTAGLDDDVNWRNQPVQGLIGCDIARQYRPGHADYTMTLPKTYGIRDRARRLGRSSAAETACGSAAGARLAR